VIRTDGTGVEAERISITGRVAIRKQREATRPTVVIILLNHTATMITTLLRPRYYTNWTDCLLRAVCLPTFRRHTQTPGIHCLYVSPSMGPVWTSTLQSNPSQPICLNVTLILTSLLRLSSKLSLSTKSVIETMYIPFGFFHVYYIHISSILIQSPTTVPGEERWNLPNS